MRYYYADKDNKPVGPLPQEALDSLKAAGIISDSTMVIEEGGSEWRRFSDAVAARVSVPPPPPPPPVTGMPTETTLARRETYSNLASIAQKAAEKLLEPFTQPREEDKQMSVDDQLLAFLVYADNFTETCCQQFANTLRRTSVLAEVRGTPTTALARQIREECFAKTDKILASYLEALKGCHIDVGIAVGRLQETSVLGAALGGAAQGQLAGGLGKTGATLGIFSAVVAGFSEREKQIGLLWEQRKALAEAKSLAGRKMIEFLESIKSVTTALLDFGCAKCFGGEVDFTLQSEALAQVERAISEKVALAINRAGEIGGNQDDTHLVEDELTKAPASGIPESILNSYKAFLGREGPTAIIYSFKCQIGLQSGLSLDVAVTNSRVWIGGIKKGGTEIIQVQELPLTQLRFISQLSKNTIFSGAISKITLKWGGFLDLAILDSSQPLGEYFYGVLKRRLSAVNPACSCVP